VWLSSYNDRIFCRCCKGIFVGICCVLACLESACLESACREPPRLDCSGLIDLDFLCRSCEDFFLDLGFSSSARDFIRSALMDFVFVDIWIVSQIECSV
jgi:hypothetical protein